jgi:hypothetical protein
MWLFNNTNFCDKKWEIVTGNVCVVTNWNTRKALNIIMVILLIASRHTVILVLNICFCLSLLIYPSYWGHFKCNSAAAAADKTGIISSRSLSTTIDSQKCSNLWKWQLKVYCLKCNLYLVWNVICICIKNWVGIHVHGVWKPEVKW